MNCVNCNSGRMLISEKCELGDDIIEVWGKCSDCNFEGIVSYTTFEIGMIEMEYDDLLSEYIMGNKDILEDLVNLELKLLEAYIYLSDELGYETPILEEFSKTVMIRHKISLK